MPHLVADTPHVYKHKGVARLGGVHITRNWVYPVDIPNLKQTSTLIATEEETHQLYWFLLLDLQRSLRK